MRVEELAMVVNLACEVGILLARRLEYNLVSSVSVVLCAKRQERILPLVAPDGCPAYLGAIGEFV